MRRLIFGLVVLTALASGWWAFYAWSTERVVSQWMAAREAEGWLARYADLSVEGFPTRFDTRLRDLELADPDTGWVWRVPELFLGQRALRPDHLRAIWPREQVLSSSRESVTIRSEVMRSELDVQPAAQFALDASVTEMQGVEVASTEGWSMYLSDGRLTGQRVEGTDDTYDVAFVAEGLEPPGPMAALLDPAGVLPQRIGTVTYRARMAFDRPWDLRAIEERRPQISQIALEDMSAQWGDMLFRATGAVDVDAAGQPEGDIAVRAENWQSMVELAVNAGAIPQQLQGSIEAVLGMVAGLSGRPENIDATLSFRDGRVFLGPLPLGPAPRLILQ
ncbi:High-affinity K+ transport system, ATPase chain B [Roseibacterium elongatum DSM 19469]|uniref:High-affinity K+ transport system, ATPase chain B n=1 Tax=Roseicyclus elongatus DSM 19469 TaxID=1294273 RepID=W8S271_9RHOB|nr:DUF2125 domain-containing protein [Roseibacterium elongatum]AHM04297.1 High-affinity K+ transport system, ATPase chain B [Roseibacterium elongatum DSM 19469]